MVKRVLVTTPLEASIPKDKSSLLLLGEWSRPYTSPFHDETVNAKVLSYHWDDRAKLYSDYNYILEFHERLVKILSKKLNELHNVQYTDRYWRIVIGPWLGFFVQSLFDRWLSIKAVINDSDILNTVIVDFDKIKMTPNDMPEFINFLIDDPWNHYIYAQIIMDHTEIKYATIKDVSINKAVQEEKGTQSKISIIKQVKKTALSIFFKLTALMSKSTDVFFLSSYLPFLTEMQLQLKLGQSPQLFTKFPIPSIEIDTDKRDFVIEGDSKTEFEAFIYSIIPKQIPRVYLEGYQKLTEYGRSLPWPKCPKVIWTSNSFESDDVFKFWAAEKVENGSKLVIGQHGGHYGIAQWSFTEDHEIKIADHYFSWGWTSHEPKVIPVGMIKGIIPMRKQLSRSKLLHIVTVIPRYSYWMYSTIVGPQYLNYLDDQFDFFSALPEGIKESSIVRLYPSDSGWYQSDRWRGKHPELKLDDGKSNMGDLYSESKIVISTCNATSYIESFRLNIPTVIFWNPAHWEIRESAKPYFDDLKKVGIFHETPQSAARHIKEVWEDVDKWWNDPDVQKVVTNFCRQYAFNNVNLISDLSKLLKDATHK